MLVTSQPKQPVSPQPHSIGPLPNLQIIPGPVLPPDVEHLLSHCHQLLVQLNLFQIHTTLTLGHRVSLTVQGQLDTSPDLSRENVRKEFVIRLHHDLQHDVHPILLHTFGPSGIVV